MKNLVKYTAQKIKKHFTWLSEKSPEIRRAIQENMSFEQCEALRNSDLGLDVDFKPKTNPQIRQKISDKFGEDSFITKGYDLFIRAFRLGWARETAKRAFSYNDSR